MQIAIISDIHGNLVSLEAVLADIEKQHIDHLVCLGDVATLGPQPKEVLARLHQLEGQFIMGNHDAILLQPDLTQHYMNATWFAENIEWCLLQLDQHDFDFLDSFRATIEFALDAETSVLFFHGSPNSNTDLILSTTTDSQLKQMLAGFEATVMIGGHSHVQMMRQYNGIMLVNAGSVGMPFKKMPFKRTPQILPWAEYTVLHWRNGILGLELRRVPVDVEQVKQVALESNLPESGKWDKNWLTNWKFL